MVESAYRAAATRGVAGPLAWLLLGLLPASLARADDGAADPGGTTAPGPVAGAAAGGAAGAAGTAAGGGGGDGVATVVVTARRLNEERASIETQIGASAYTIDSGAITAAPGGENQSLNQVLLQMPDVVQDSFGQLHVRGDHNDLQYRINGVILPEGISVFSQTLSPRFISSMSLITGALPAEYGLRTAGIIELTTNSGTLQPGGYVSVYGGSFGTFQPSFEYGGRAGSYSYYATGDYKESAIGIDSPDGSTDPLHDHTSQVHLFSYMEKILNEENRLSVILGVSDGSYQIPNQRGLEPSLGLDVEGTTQFLSNYLNENQRELAEFGALSWQHSAGALNWVTSLSARYTSLHFVPDWVGDTLYNGIAQDAFKSDTAVAWQTDASYKLSPSHTLRAGFFLQHDDAESYTTSWAMPVDPAFTQFYAQTSTVPQVVVDNGSQAQELESVYLQDEWRVVEPLTVNYGVRFDHYSAYSSGSQASPRVNFVWQLPTDTTVHGGYSRYYTPPPFELIGSSTVTKFLNTSALPPGCMAGQLCVEDSPPIADKANYYDLGVLQKLLDNSLTLGVDGYYQQAQNLIDEGQFGAPIILTPFNYRWGSIGGVEFTANYTLSNFSAYANTSFQAAHGKDWETAQFNFTPEQYAFVQDHYIHLDHEGRVAASGGMSYLWMGTRFSTDFIFGTGLRQDELLPDGFDVPNGDHTPSYTQVNVGASHEFHLASGPLTLQLAVINVADKVYEIRSGTGVGVFAPQYGPRRGFYGGLAWEF
jgi:outer membrane receptor for ferrienterochelin and colicins